jgi:hypothetical protein
MSDVSQTKKPRPEEAVGVIPRLMSWLWGGPPSECLEAIELLPLEEARKRRVVLLNAFVLPKKPMIVITMPSNPENARAIVRWAEGRVESFIGHESTAKLLSEILGVEVPVNRGEYEPQASDIAIVVRLRRRLATPQDVKEIKLEDLEFHIVHYSHSWVLGYD